MTIKGEIKIFCDINTRNNAQTAKYNRKIPNNIVSSTVHMPVAIVLHLRCRATIIAKTTQKNIHDPSATPMMALNNVSIEKSSSKSLPSRHVPVESQKQPFGHGIQEKLPLSPDDEFPSTWALVNPCNDSFGK